MDTVLKVVLLGESGVGKTCIINKFTTGFFDRETISNLSAQFISKTMELKEISKTIKFDIWDTAGQEKYRSLAKIFYKDAKVICLCYDITNKKSFTELRDYWYEQNVKDNAQENPIFAVVGNKVDLYEMSQVKDEEGRQFAKDINGIFQLTSAKSDFGINKLFEHIGIKYFNPEVDFIEDENKEKQDYEQEKAKIEKNKQKERAATIPRRGVKILDKSKLDNNKSACC